MTNEEIKKVIEEVIGNDDQYLNNLVFDIVTKIIKLPNETNTNIAELINYERGTVSPLTQGKDVNLVDIVCKKLNIKLVFNRDNIGGLAYYYSFKKVENTKENDALTEKIKNIILEYNVSDNVQLMDDALDIILKIIQMEDGTENSISNLLHENIKQYNTEQLFEMEKLVNEVCLRLNIELDKSKYKGQFEGLPFNIPFVKKSR